MSAALNDWLNTSAESITTTCRCGTVIEATSRETLRAMQAGHWMFDEQHERFVAAEAVAR